MFFPRIKLKITKNSNYLVISSTGEAPGVELGFGVGRSNQSGFVKSAFLNRFSICASSCHTISEVVVAVDGIPYESLFAARCAVVNVGRGTDPMGD